MCNYDNKEIFVFLEYLSPVFYVEQRCAFKPYTWGFTQIYNHGLSPLSRIADNGSVWSAIPYKYLLGHTQTRLVQFTLGECKLEEFGHFSKIKKVHQRIDVTKTGVSDSSQTFRKFIICIFSKCNSSTL